MKNRQTTKGDRRNQQGAVRGSAVVPSGGVSVSTRGGGRINIGGPR